MKAKLSVFRSVFVPILTYGHEYWVMIERVRSQERVAKWVSCEKSEVYPYLTRLKALAFFQHQIATTPHRTITTVLVWPCDTNVPQANHKATNGCFSKWQKV